MVIRAARPEDGPAIGKLFVGTAGADLDWTDPGVADWWLVADRDGEVVGAIQVTCSRPVGSIGDLVVVPAVRGPGEVPAALYVAAEAVLRRAGVQRVTCSLRPARAWRRIVERWGWTASVEGTTLMVKDLR